MPITIWLIWVNFHNFVLSHWPIGTESERVICWVMWIEASGEAENVEHPLREPTKNCRPARANAYKALTRRDNPFFSSLTQGYKSAWLSLASVCTHERIPEEFSSVPDTPALHVESYIKTPRVKRSARGKKRHKGVFRVKNQSQQFYLWCARCSMIRYDFTLVENA